MRFKKLVIVSDTALIYKDGYWHGFNAVVNEIECIENLFDTIVWIGVLRKDLENSPTLKKVTTKNIKIIPLPFVGGKSFLSKIKIFLFYPIFLLIILKHIVSAEVVHTRLPSHPAFIAVLLSFILRKKLWWNKFAGSWDSSTLPFFYKFQKNILIYAKHTKVTINGFWANQPKHCLSFENPCLTEGQIEQGEAVAKRKRFCAPFVFVFIGRLDAVKGVPEIIKALKKIPSKKIASVHFIGNGVAIETYKQETAFLQEKVVFHGFQDSVFVHKILAQAHLLLLPSKSEGFPKVIAEAACYGVIPVVSNVGSIPHYINEENGFLWDIFGVKSYTEILLKAVTTNPENLKEKALHLTSLAKNFTFVKYYQELKTKIFNESKSN